MILISNHCPSCGGATFLRPCDRDSLLCADCEFELSGLEMWACGDPVSIDKYAKVKAEAHRKERRENTQ